MDTFLLGRGKKLFAQQIQAYEPQDPLYETYTDSKGRQKRRKVSWSLTAWSTRSNTIYDASIEGATARFDAS